MAIYADAPASLVVEHNQLTNGQGILVNGEGLTTSPFSASYNNYTDIGRYNQADWNPGAVHTDDITIPGATMVWNRITSHYTTSVSEDVFGLVSTNGSSGNPVDVVPQPGQRRLPVQRRRHGLLRGRVRPGRCHGSYSRPTMTPRSTMRAAGSRPTPALTSRSATTPRQRRLDTPGPPGQRVLWGWVLHLE